jgi:hypothetical protein
MTFCLASPELSVNAMRNMKKLCFRSNLKLFAFVFASFSQASFAGINSGEPDLSTKLYSACAADAAKMFRDRETQIQEIIKTIGGSPNPSNAGVVKAALAYPPFEINRETAQAILDFEIANPGYNLQRVFKETRDDIYRQIIGDIGNTNRFSVKYPDADILKVAIANLKRLKTFREELVALAFDSELESKLQKIEYTLSLISPRTSAVAFIGAVAFKEGSREGVYDTLTLNFRSAMGLREFASLFKKSIYNILNGKKIELPRVFSEDLQETYLHDPSGTSLVARFPEFAWLLVSTKSLPGSGRLDLTHEELGVAQAVVQALSALEFLQRYPMERLDSALKSLSI